jgi:hypothetical protein
MMMHHDDVSRREMISLQVSAVELKYLKSLVRLQSVDLMAVEAGLSSRSIRAYLCSIDWALKSAGCFE